MTSTAVRVGLRVRPLTQKEQLSNCTECLSFIPDEPQILIGTDKSFTFDYVYDSNTPQVQVYDTAAKPLIEKFLDGFNATILAYGQTGSGKTYSMGTSLENSANAEQEGIVPRCIVQLYRSLQERMESIPGFDYQVYVSFLELYNEELIDLLNPYNTQKRKGGVITGTAPAEVTIREDVAGNIYWSGVKEELCSSPEELLGFLAKGSLCRTTGSTDMNTVSSRSHAVFSVILKQTRPDLEDTKSLTSKFHFVDLAGSERLKRTNAQGDRAKEGIAINSGLLALGNVISALGDEHRKGSHVPYRDSKLTRLLQDSLGGNSQTLMLACVSPADANFMETLNTLKYANRARNIKNRVVINQDFAGSSIEVNQLRAQIARLRMENASLRAEGLSGSVGSRNNTGSYMAMDEHRALRNEVNRLRDRIQELSTSLIQVTSERDTMVMERELGEFLKYEEELDARVPSRRPSYDLANSNNDQQTQQQSILDTNTRIQAHPLVAQYQKTIQDLNNELADTKDRLNFLENAKTYHPQSSTTHQSAQLSLSSSTLSFTQSSHIGGRQRKSNRRRRRPLMSSSSSTTTSGRRGLRARRSHISYSGRTQRLGYTEDMDEDYSYHPEQEQDIRTGVKDSIAKAREEIQKGMQVLELIKPLEDTAQEWEKELQAFEEAESKLYNGRDTGSDEGNFTASPSPDGQRSDSSFFDEIESLAVPSWEDDLKTTKNSSNDNKSITSSQDDKSTPSSNGSKHEDGNTYSEKYNPQLVRMLHQIQSDIRVKEELVSHLEKSETEYTFMRRKFDDKIGALESKLESLQREKDEALARTKSGFASNNHLTNSKSDGVQLREKQQLVEIRHAYESKMKSLLSEIQDLRRKYSQTTMTMQATRNQNDTLLRSLRVNVETLKMEKKRMIKRMKQEAERVREQMTLQDRKIHQLQRLNAEANQARRRLEKEHEAQKLTLKRRNEEVLMNNNQLKQLTNVLKKAVREGGVLDERLLTKVSKAMGGSFAIMARGGGLSFRTSSSSTTTYGRRRSKNPIPVQVRATRKKQLLDRALYQLIQGKQAIVEMEQLLFKRERLAAEKLELAEERKQIYLAEKENAELTGQPMNSMGVEFMDERIDMISAEISYLSARIRALQSEAAGGIMDEPTNNNGDGSTKQQQQQQQQQQSSEKRVTFADEIISDSAMATMAASHDEWMDIDAMEEQFNVPAAAAPEVAYDMTIKILKSLEVDECRRIAEGLVDDIVNVRTSECNRQVTMQNLERTVHDLRRTLIVMKRAAIATTVDNERRIRKLEGGSTFGSDDEKDSAIDVKIEEYINNGNTIFDKIYEDGLRGMITTPEPGSTDYYPATISINGSPISSSTGEGSSMDETALLSPLLSPASTNGSTTNSTTGPTRPELLSNAAAILNGTKPPTGLSPEKGKYINRETTPSPDRFFNMIQKRMSWQQQQQRSDSPMAISMINPAEFARYTTTDRESSTSSIRSSHLRRSSIQSDQSLSQPDSSNSSQGGSVTMRKRAFSLQQPPVPTRRRASLRELSLMGSTASTSPRHGNNPDQMVPSYYQQQHQQQHQQQYYHNKDLPASPRVSASVMHHHHQQQQQQQQRIATLRRPSSVSTFAPQSINLMHSDVAMERGSSAGSNNVFDRLSQTPTRASSAKMQYRHSISSMDDLQQRWEPSSRSSSAMSGTFYN
ncbi:uncharacterized protein BX664DRAFT_360608 [Halteromyces radiatus]|uniref:uncharacterized protein n=1 Tax=Halteromyces radiatus TaxID=101107 RepID=UPI00221FD271|nr:uncharacterized protein BX664DRAFT_360608 [Halteromyces radiatus]KAI8084778.1 hypothetical protein BX664DRAFT_360608 [Halteromyces radiatus]